MDFSITDEIEHVARLTSLDLSGETTVQINSNNRSEASTMHQAQPTLRCKPGDLARIRKAWNELLEGRLVFIRRAYSSTEWLVYLLDGPAFSVSEDRCHLVVARSMIADDWALEPVGGQIAGDAVEVTDSVDRSAHRLEGACEVSE